MTTFNCNTLSTLKDKALEVVNLLPDCTTIEETEGLLRGFNLHYIAHNSKNELERAEKVALFDYITREISKKERLIVGI